jgi:hypothetical protein
MKHSQHQYLLFFNPIKDLVRKAMDDSPPNIQEHLLIQLWSFRDLFQPLLNSIRKIHPQARSLALVPVERLIELSVCFRPQDNGKHYFRTRLRASSLTTSQGMTAFGEAAWAAMRRSNSCFWASVKERSPGSAAMLSQIASTM